MKTNKTFIMNTKKIFISLLVVCTLVFSSLGVMSLFNFNKASAATYDFEMVNESLEPKYYRHWASGQGQLALGESSGRWYFGYGDVKETSTYTFTQAGFDSSQQSKPYTTGTAHQMHWQFNVSTRQYSSANTQTMFVWQAEETGTVSFSGAFSKATSNKQELGGASNGYDNIWLAGINWSNADFNWVDGQSYTCSMWKVSASGTVSCVNETTYTQEYVWLVPKTEFSVVSGDKFVFGLKCNNANGNEWYTNTLGFFTSEFLKQEQDSGNIEPPVIDPVDPDMPDSLEDIVAPQTGFTKIAQYKFADAADLGKDTLGKYNLTNVNLTKGTNGVSLEGMSSAEKYMYAPKIAKDGSDFSDLIKGSFSVSFKIYAKQGAENDGDHVILSTGDGTDGFEVLWKTTDLVVKAAGQEYRIDNAIVEDDMGVASNIYMLDEDASWYRYTIVYDETNEEDIHLKIRVDRFNDEGTMYGDMTVITKKRLQNKIKFGGSADYTFAIGANSAFGAYNVNFARGYDSLNQVFSPIIADLSVYSGVVTDAEIVSIWQADEGDNYYDRSASWKLDIDNDIVGGTVSGAKSIEYGDKTKLNITVEPNTGYRIKSIKWNAGSGDVDVPIADPSQSVTFQKTITSDCSLKVEYEQVLYNITVKANGVKDTALSKKYPAMSTFNVDIQPNEGNEIESVTWNGELITRQNFVGYNKNGFTFSASVIGESTLEIVYVKKQFSVMFKVNGVTDRELTKKVDMNDEVFISIVAPAGQKIDKLVCGKEIIEITEENKTKVEFTIKVTAATTVQVEFVEDNQMLGCSSSVTPVYMASALVLIAGAVLLIKKAKKSK